MISATQTASQAVSLSLPRRLAIVVNPKGGRGGGRRGTSRLELLEGSIRQHAKRQGIDPPAVLQTERPGHGAELAKEAANDGFDTVVAAGGDGTISEVANGLIGTHARMGIIPIGTGNDLARHVGISRDIGFAVATVFTGHSLRIDAGKTGDHWFVNASSVGFDAQVAHQVNTGWRWLSGTPAYTGAALQTLLTYRPTHMRLDLDGEVFERDVLLCAVCNSRSYGGGMQIAPNAKLNDGLFDICLVRATSKLEFMQTFPKVFAGKHTSHPKVEMRQAKKVRIASEPPVRVNVDGDIVGFTPIEFEMIPSALELIVPETFLAHCE